MSDAVNLGCDASSGAADVSMRRHRLRILRGQSGRKYNVVAASMSHGKMPMLKMVAFNRWNEAAQRKANTRVRLQSRSGTINKSNASPP
jgi:hypothetical protein